MPAAKTIRVEVLLLLLVLAISGRSNAAQCGSALLVEVAPPAAFDGFDPGVPVAAHYWEVGAGGANRNDLGCQSGCTFATGAACLGAADCLALTGVMWLNANCSIAGHLPQRTAFVAEQTTVDAGGVWAAINLDRNATDANTDLDAKAATACGSCASVASPILGGTGYPQVSSPTISGAHLTAMLSWSVPATAAQALSNGAILLKSYTLLYKVHAGTPPAMTGDRSGWIQTPDIEPDGAANGGHSTNATASVGVTLPVGSWFVTFVVGLNFDGTGNPTVDSNTRPSKFLSDQSDPIQATVNSSIFSDGFETGNTSQWSSATP